MNNTAAKVLGTSNDIIECEKCGRTELKGTVALSFDGGAPVFYGVVCAARATGRKVSDIRNAASAANTLVAEGRRLAALTLTFASTSASAAAASYLTRNAHAAAALSAPPVILRSDDAYYALPAGSPKIEALTANGWILS